MKTINRDKIQRMVGQVAGGGGGGGSVDLSGYATQAWVEQNYISKKFFSSLLKIYNGTDTDTNEIKPNAELPTNKTNVNIKAMFGFWTQQYLSSLGKNSSSGGGGGGGATYIGDLQDVIISNPQSGQVLVYRSGNWVNEDAPQSGGGTVTSIALNMPTGFLVAGSPIKTRGTFEVSFVQGYSLLTTAEQTKWNSAATKVTTLEGYFDAYGNAKSALKLTTVNKKAWGQTYWTANGVPDSISGDINDADNIYMSNNKRFYIKNANGQSKSCLTIDTSNNLVIGEGMADASNHHTYLRGWDLTFQVYSGGNTTALTINSSGLVEIVQNDQGIKIGDAYIVWDSINQALKVTGASGAAMDFYATGGVSALGYSS